MSILNMVRKSSVVVLAAAVLTLAPVPVWACPVCFGATDSPIASALNLAILALLGITCAVLGGFVAFFVYLAKRAKLAREAEAYGEELLHG